MEEKWKKVYTIDQILKIQQLELMNLGELQRVCEIIDTPFFLYGGSLIGAVRHQGFVPWDDDLDIAMLRHDYQRFVQEAPRYLADEFILQTPYNDKKSPYFYTKLRIKGTKCVEFGNHRLPIEHGVYVDIYPIDNLPDDDGQLLKHYKKYQQIVRLFVLRQNPYRGNPSNTLTKKIKAVIKFGVSMVLHLVPHGVFVRTLDKLSTSENGTTTRRSGNYSFFNPTNIFVDIKPFDRGVFEGIPVNLPGNWDYHLSSRYGSYMEFPPEEKRLGHEPYILDFGKYDKE